ncbi:MAG TPA: PPC domain-containing protein [Vitreimonas sp.]|uniref:PPC domain-containing protein n=1 Tax=Vitreimonas sp. TaxID=3069702 RepID=UPI002D2F7EF0|nr:PPC domain-containing protein [Vitreimonas sp.]HYD89609.1 PPC domain-containing protein [Vitreimonas sp.]
MRGKLLFGAATAALLMSFAGAASAQDNDPAGDASTTAALNGAVDGQIDSAGDVDWYRLRVEQGQRYSFTLDGMPGADGQALDPMIAIYDGEGVQLAFNDDANGFNSAVTYAPGASGEVFVEARAFSEQATGGYRLSVSASPLPRDDAGNSADTRARIAPGRAVGGSIEYEGDVDWYRLAVRTGQRYRITLDGADDVDTADGALGDPMLRIIDADGNELAMGDDTEESLNAAIDYIPRANGEVFIEARGYADAYTGAYALNVAAERLPTDAIANNRSTRGRIDLGDSVNGNLEFPTDTDWYRVRLAEGETYRFTLTSSGDNAFDPLVRVYDANGQEVAVDDDGGEGLNSYLEFTATAAGNYFVEAAGFSEEAVGTYTLAAMSGDIPSDASTDAVMSADGDYREGGLAPAGDRDWYRLELAEGQAVRINADVVQTADALGDPYLVLYGPDGTEIARDDDGGEGLNAFLEYQATAAGAHYVEVRGFAEDASGRYAVGVIAGEIGQSIDNADYFMPNGEGRFSRIGAADDADWYMIEMIEGRPYRITLEGAGETPLADPYLTLYDSQGNAVVSDDDGGMGLNSYLSYASPTGGTFFLGVSSYGASGTGQYNLRAVDTDVPGNAYTDENLDPADDSRVSRIDMLGDLDQYRVTLEAGVRYTIDVRGEGDNPLADPFVTILDANGESVVTDDDSGDGLDARLRFTPQTAGEYYIQASGLGGSLGGYQVQIVRQ